MEVVKVEVLDMFNSKPLNPLKRQLQNCTILNFRISKLKFSFIRRKMTEKIKEISSPICTFKIFQLKDLQNNN